MTANARFDFYHRPNLPHTDLGYERAEYSPLAVLGIRDVPIRPPQSIFAITLCSYKMLLPMLAIATVLDYGNWSIVRLAQI